LINGSNISEVCTISGPKVFNIRAFISLSNYRDRPVVMGDQRGFYMQALEPASTVNDFVPFTELLSRLVEARLKGKAIPLVLFNRVSVTGIVVLSIMIELTIADINFSTSFNRQLVTL